MHRVTVIVHARNAAAGLAKLLPTVRWAGAIVVVDMESTDDTADVALAHGAKVVPVELHPRVDAVRNRFLETATTEWILVMDADEYLADDAAELVAGLIAEHGTSRDAFAIPRLNRIGSHVMRGSGWYPDQQIRLFRRGTVRWSDSTHRPPEVLSGRERLLLLKAPGCLHIHHDNYTDLRAFIERQVRYALNDVYDPHSYEPDRYAAAALEAFAGRHDPEADGDLSRALAVIMAWDQVIRGLIHWDQLADKPSLEGYLTLPAIGAVPTPRRSRVGAWLRSLWRRPRRGGGSRMRKGTRS
ncbi:MAG: glycosyltransferase family 2 protein [Planctomycetia bacterium]|nr:glycosyltransferase family 2 protein [Planctomycetia bacterium]